MPTQRYILSGLLLCLLGTVPVAAQDATLHGVVPDDSKAGIRGVRIAIHSIATGVVKTVQTNESGFYSVLLPAPATYAVEAAMSGFATVRQSLKLNVGQTARVDFTLKVGAVSESVEVSAAA